MKIILCLNIIVSSGSISSESGIHEVMSYCLTDFPFKWNIQENDIDQKLTFCDLSKQNIISEQLYQWSAPINLIEQYEFYFISNKMLSSIFDEVFYNCTSPRFGPQCQYEFVYTPSENLILYEIQRIFIQLKNYILPVNRKIRDFPI